MKKSTNFAARSGKDSAGNIAQNGEQAAMYPHSYMLFDKIQMHLTVMFPDLMTRKVAFGATLPVDLLAVAIWLILLTPSVSLVLAVRRWLCRPRVKMYTYVMPLSSYKVWPPPTDETANAPVGCIRIEVADKQDS